MNFFLHPAQEPAQFWEWLSRIADALGIASFLMTLILILITKSIRQQFVSRIRLPELNKTLAKLCKELSTYDIGSSNESEVQKCLGQTKAKLKEAKNLIKRNERKPFKTTIQQIELLMKSKISQPAQQDKDLYWKMYGSLHECLEIISQNCNIARQV